MGGTLTFPIDDTLKSIVEHAASNPMGTTYGEPINEPSLHFVKDRGAYLMSAAAERQMAPHSTPERPRCLVVYAKGHNPDTGDYDYDRTRSVCGGDDFAEAIPIKLLQDGIARGATTFRIKLTANRMTLEVQ